MSLEEERRQWEVEALRSPLPEDVNCVEESISGVSCVWVSEEKSDTDRVLLYLHGGGLVSGSAVTHLNFAAEMTKYFGISVLLINYRLLPENEYPAPLEDTLLVYNALISKQIYTPNQIIFGGDSSGGGLVLAGLVQLKELEQPLPCCAFTLSGAFDMTLSGESMQTNSHSDPIVSLEELKIWRKQYLHFDQSSPLLSPIFADLSGLPPILLIAGGKEPWLSDSLRVAKKIKLGKGKVLLKVWQTMGHVWIVDSKHKESEEALNEIYKFIR